ncbi:DNA-binding MarR family transcriptional regulator [Nocardia transvalensis]|uniref:DNA-binding MarR family transcriptional regulator n=3 Tax=Nocardia transvalensis TaxID=37333 RepID=A0A7W9ULN3_9NOCA|nr:DNA-binding MarR family transcriptional regulator [Nocardia transvalensis]
MSRVANLLGAAALAVSDRMVSDVTAQSQLSPSASAALVVLLESGPVGVTELSRCLGLTQSAATRTLDALESAGLIRRTTVGRGRSVALTDAGRREATKILRARVGWLEGLVGALDEGDRAHLERILGRLLTAIYDAVPESNLLCRLCDRRACTRGQVCPVGQAARDRSG